MQIPVNIHLVPYKYSSVLKSKDGENYFHAFKSVFADTGRVSTALLEGQQTFCIHCISLMGAPGLIFKLALKSGCIFSWLTLHVEMKI